MSRGWRTMTLKLLKQSLLQAPIVKKGKYNYVVHPITDGIPEIRPELLTEITDEMKKHIQKLGPIDKIVTMEAMGIPLATKLSLDLGIPMTIIRKKQYGLPCEISVEQETGYSKAKFFINGLLRGETVVIVDDVLSTGGTLRAILSVLSEIGVIVKEVYIAIYKGTCYEEVQKKFDIPLHFLVKIKVLNGETILINSKSE